MLAFFAVVLGCAYFVVSSSSDIDHAAVVGENQDSTYESNLLDFNGLENRRIRVTNPNSATLGDSVTQDAISYQEHISDRDAFSDRHGVFSEDDLIEYVSYPNEALTPLAARGDLKAIETLAKRASRAGDVEAQNTLYFWSTVHGGTMSLTYRAVDLFHEGITDGHVVNREPVKEAFASLELAAKRGYLNSLRTGFYYMERYNIELDESELQEITARADELYGRFSEIREDLGLEPFDNSISVPMLIGMQEDYPLANNPTGWGLQYYQ